MHPPSITILLANPRPEISNVQVRCALRGVCLDAAGRLNGDFVIASYQPTTTLLNIGGARVTGLFGQSFLTTDTGVLANIQLRLVQSGPSALGVQVRVHSTSGGLPSTVLAA